MTIPTPGRGSGAAPARLAPVHVAYDSVQSVSVAARLTADMSGARGRVVRVSGWALTWDRTIDDLDPHAGAVQLAIGYRRYVSPCEVVSPCWMYVRPKCATSTDLRQVARRVLDGGLSTARLLAACQQPPGVPAGGWTVPAWEQAGYPLIAKHPDENLACLQFVTAIDALDDEQRRVAIALGDGWTGTPTQLVATVHAILADPT